MTLDEVGRWRDAAAHMCDRLVALLPEDQREDHRLTEDGYDVGIGPGTLPDLAAKVVRHVSAERDALRAERDKLRAALLRCKACGEPATRRIDGGLYCDAWGESDDDLPTAAAVRGLGFEPGSECQ